MSAGAPPEQTRTNYLFSATMPIWVKKLARNYLSDPVTVDLIGDDRVKIADTLKVLQINVPISARRTVLVDLLTVYGAGSKAIVFTQVTPPRERKHPRTVEGGNTRR
eukprot:126500-Pyramimonas_sp.AAC.1